MDELLVERTLRIAAALLRRPDGRVLVVRKRGTSAFMQPGGKIEPDEAPMAALVRELGEELGLVVAPEHAAYLGRFTAQAANEPGYRVDAEVFRVDIVETVVPAAEIVEIAWIDPRFPPDLHLAPLTRDQILPFHCAEVAGRV